MINPNTIAQIFQTLRIEDIIKQEVTLIKKGANLIGCCPFHEEKTPSFTVSPAKGIYKCFGCQKAGNGINFLMDHGHKTYPEALKYVADYYNILIDEKPPTKKQLVEIDNKKEMAKFNNLVAEFYHKQLFEPENALVFEYALSRFSLNSIKEWKIGFAPGGYTTLYNIAKDKGYKNEFLVSTSLVTKSQKNGKYYDFMQKRLVFPVLDISKEVISFSARILPWEDTGDFSKFLNLKDTLLYKKSEVLYGMNKAVTPISNNKSAVLVEGNPDTVAMHELNITNVVAPCGTSLADGQIKLLNRFADRITLLFDGDTAGKNALLKYGKQIVEHQIIPYAAILPDKQDPASFFTSEKHYNQWIKDNKVDFITWYSNKIFSVINNDPSKQNDAIIEICDLLFNLSLDLRKAYIENVAGSNKLKAKLFTDRFKILDATNIKKEDPQSDTHEGVDLKQYGIWGFYQHNNSYYFSTKGGKEKLSNFVMKPIFHIDTANDSKRIYELINEHGYSVVVNLDMNEMTSLQGFQRNVESKGNFMFWGSMAHFQKLKLRLYEQTRTCQEVLNLGWQKEGFWAWSNGMIDDAGKFQPIDEFGIVNYNDQDFFIPAYSKIYLKDKSIFLDERKFRYQDSKVKLKDWMDLYLKVHGDNAMIGFAWYISAIFRDHILYKNDNFPLLNLFGQKGSGKNTLAYSLLSLFGKKQTEFNIHNGTKPGLAKHLEMFQNAIAFIDEYKNSLDFDKIETLKSIYNAIGRSRLNMDKGGKKETTEVNQAVIVAGQEMPTIDVALASRMILLIFLDKEGLPQSAKDDFEALQDMERDGLPHITVEILKHRKYFIEHYKVNYDAVMRQLVEDTKQENINDRLLRNICATMAAFKTIENKIEFSFDYQRLYTFGLQVTRNQNNQIKKSDEIGIFWSLLEALFDDNNLIDKWHFRVGYVESITTSKGVLNFPDRKRVLKFKFNAIAKLYSEHLRKSGIKPLPQDSLQHYLTTNKYFIGVERSCKFSRKDYSVADGNVIQQNQTTSAFCFDYDLLGICLTREDKVYDRSANNNNTTVDAPKDKEEH